ncbi:hypothetical protein A3K29_05720 [Candidatus Collierbacteria bacterium RIFOXYB2_FULL_46_14]|uniref:5-bromo-4-chloroindolyl phosphate hydrolysis protein n=1 Tax=Candidatus Collierbacteria bacterium GW2011_GWA2_46_26 TaxID=1618381 RepID=A0A0G1RRK9_9BACT|nr:MAG: hypothetical protein UX47_C0009G0015 [Candidatus Collierbacteria bacterium GW2011_GWA2_46_26]OGD73587.1 MAG: hypothetical protein A3K29_05720 [Candidatus Collierbacteria bacterium RIFOXYB2_FULL_46_14]OGD76629.1 MAG: hypothetical protein A3K43_05720 [Candidatus Collierbacteria bacterium RIFOXYA2_FULL_46_20]OGD77965.1 MAG: hypothetical protein A3K39_05720 [Candidatus Collierbacteria bacterium RIFOXYC2_FULL_43_15]OGD79989.1 MAG: hypothetical protein A2320_00150 [Pseudomonadales bacterium G
MEQKPSGNPLWLLLTLPVFFLVWWLAAIEYAFIIGFGTFVTLYVLFVWLPDDQARKLNRIAKFSEAKKLLKFATLQLNKVRDSEIVEEDGKALLTLEGLINEFESKKTVQGKVEEKVLPMLRNLTGLLKRWLGHESGMYPLETVEAKKVRGILLHFDDLILKYQKDGIDPTDTYLTGLYELETDMQSAGIDPEGGR